MALDCNLKSWLYHLLLPSCVTLGELLGLSEPECPHLCNRGIVPCSQVATSVEERM